MLNWQLHIEITGGPSEMRDEWPRIKREAHREFGEWWHENYYPLHFQSFAATRYGYEPRTREYRERKRRIMGHDLPLVYSGSFRQETTSWAEIRATEEGASVTMRAQVLNLVGRSSRDPNYPDIREEATTVAPQEQQRFAEWLDDVTTGRMNELQGTTR